MPAGTGPSRPSFRPRPIDLAKPLPIIKSSKDLRHEDDVVVNRALPTIATGVDPSEEEEQHLQQALLASVFGKSDKPPDIPVPVVSSVPAPAPTEARGGFKLPDTYIQFDKNDGQLLKEAVEYDADWLDIAFSKQSQIPIDMVETVMDALEKTQGQLHQQQAANGTGLASDQGGGILAGLDNIALGGGTTSNDLVKTKRGDDRNDANKNAAGKANDNAATETTEKLMPDRSLCADFDKLTLGLSGEQRDQLFQHWFQRRTKHKKSFLRFFQPPPDPNDTDPSVAFRPRDREGGVPIAQRMNTYDNYRRALIIRDELSKLTKILAMVVERERKKEQLLTLRLLLQRVKVTRAAPFQVDNIVRHVFGTDSEPVLQLPSHQQQARQPQSQGQKGDQQAQTLGVGMGIVPCRGIQVPPDIAVATRRFVNDKQATKKQRRKSKVSDRRIPVSGANASKDPSASHDGPANSAGMLGANTSFDRFGPNMSHPHLQQHSPTAIAQAAVDAFGFDEHGNRFLKLMRCFAGGFNNYGVSPYDHRVFAAASERNTVRALPREPKTVLFPSPSIKFGDRIGEDEDDDHDDDDDESIVDLSNKKFAGARGRGIRRGLGKGKHGGKVGPLSSPSSLSSSVTPPFLTPKQIQEDILTGRDAPSVIDTISSRPTKVRRTVRVRGRVGRGGRIVLDRVPFEPERGAKAASYPASVEMGGVYTGGIPLDSANRVAKEVASGAMGNISRLSSTSVCGEKGGDEDNTADDEDCKRTFARHLHTPLRPMVEMAKGLGLDPEKHPDVVNYWPKKRKNSHIAMLGEQKRFNHLHGVHEPVDDDVVVDLNGENGHDEESDAETETLSVLRQHDDLRRLPAYYPRDDSPIHDLFHR